MEKVVFKDHADLAGKFNEDEERVDWHDETLWWIRQKRDKAAWSLAEEWEPLREAASQIKSHTLSQLSEYLVQFEKQAQANGVVVHWAKNALEHNQIVHGLLSQYKVTQIVKGKSMLTEECHLNDYLKAQGID
ncbi:MAG TPA: LUD domain-containing protein, partial [Flavisolibacter sp.]|nr:LUD domain-containing protein [Flavisolibacter sp.]